MISDFIRFDIGKENNNWKPNELQLRKRYRNKKHCFAKRKEILSDLSGRKERSTFELQPNKSNRTNDVRTPNTHARHARRCGAAPSAHRSGVFRSAYTHTPRSATPGARGLRLCRTLAPFSEVPHICLGCFVSFSAFAVSFFVIRGGALPPRSGPPPTTTTEGGSAIFAHYTAYFLLMRQGSFCYAKLHLDPAKKSG